MSIGAFALTAAGAHELFQRAGQPIGIGDAIYYGLIAFVFNAPVSPGTTSPLALEIGRLLAPMTLATAAIQVFSTRLIVLSDRSRARRMTDHTVIVGLSKAGSLLAERLANDGSRVVILESNASHPRAFQVRSRRIAIVYADASVPANLELVGIGRAKQLISLAGTAGQNAAVAAAVNTARNAAAANSAKSFHSYIEIDDHATLRDLQQVSASQGWANTQEFFSLDERAAQMIVSHMSLHKEEDAYSLLITGSSALALWVLSRVGRERIVASRDIAGWSARPLLVTVIVAEDDDHDSVKSEICGTRQEGVALTVLTVGNARLERDLKAAVGSSSWSQVLIADADELRRLRLGLALRRLPNTATTPTTIIAQESASLQGLAAAQWSSTKIVVLPEAVCHEELVTWGRLKDMARSIHEGYRRRMEAQLDDEDGRVSMADTPWECLSGELKAENIEAAKAVLRFLHEDDYVVGPLHDLDAALTPLPEDVVARIAEKEHNRWRSGKPNSASIADWSRTSPSNMTKTLEQVRRTPALLAFAGLQVARTAMHTRNTTEQR